MRVLQSIAFLLCFTVTVFAQGTKYNNAVFSLEGYMTSEYKDTDALLEALKNINACAEDPEWSLKPKTWFLKGKVSYYVFNDSILSKQNNKAPFDASQAFQKSLIVSTEKFSDSKKAKDFLLVMMSQLYNAGVVLIKENDNDNAYKYFMEVRNIKKFLDGIGYGNEIDEKNKKAYAQTEIDATYNAAICMLRMDKKAEAAALMQELIDRGQDTPILYNNIANFSLESGDTTKALEILTKGIEKYPDTLGRDLRISEINVYINQRKTDLAISKIETAARLLPNNPELIFVLADAYGKAGKMDEAEKNYLKAAAVDPNGPTGYKAYNNLGAMYIDKGNVIHKEMMDNNKLTQIEFDKLKEQRNDLYRKALPYLEKAYAIKPKEKEIIRVLKEIYAKLEMYDKSKEMKVLLEQMGG